MPPVSGLSDDVETQAFTILNQESDRRRDDDITVVVEFNVPPGKSVNVVKPLQRREDDDRNHLNSAKREIEMAAPAVGPQTILDPKFSRALDFKLRRLKEKEAIQQNLRRPLKFRPKNRNITSSDSNLNRGEFPTKKMSRSQPHIALPDDGNEKTSPKADKSPNSPNRRSKRNTSVNSESEKPRFVTTVKTGRFLLPPPDVAKLLGLHTLYPEDSQIVYSYSSKPKAVACRPKRSMETEPSAKADLREQKRLCAANAFTGVRSLVAGIVGMKSHFNQRGSHFNQSDGLKGEDHLSGSNTSVPYANVMHDKRVARGSNYAQPPQVGAGDADMAAARQARARRRAAARRMAAARLRPGTPPPAPGRRHHPIQTEYYLEELFDKGVEMSVGCQTDLFLDRPATPVYVPAKTGADASTQIYPGELFDFDLEVQPILEVLVGKTVEQALSEVAQEEELATLREQQRRFVELRDAERAERERLAEEDRRLEAEKERRLAEARAARVTALETKERAAAATLVQGYLADLIPSVLENLRDQGYLQDNIQRSVDDDFIPWLTDAVATEVESIITSRDVITEIVRDVVEARAAQYRATGEREAEERVQQPSEPSTEPSVLSEYGEEMELNETEGTK